VGAHQKSDEEDDEVGAHEAEREPLADQRVRVPGPGKVDVRLPGKGNSNSHDARPVYQNHLDEWIRTSRLSIKNFLWSRVSRAGLL
jgi:hypothetical protein